MSPVSSAPSRRPWPLAVELAILISTEAVVAYFAVLSAQCLGENPAHFYRVCQGPSSRQNYYLYGLGGAAAVALVAAVAGHRTRRRWPILLGAVVALAVAIALWRWGFVQVPSPSLSIPANLPTVRGGSP